jgi:UDP-2-acetamido-3-amino-2,3-dideoxy-glucuronate N-acetyltransferase
VDAVLLATPAATHHDLALRALEAGKHVFVEKPLALTAAEARALAETADRLDRVLMVGHILEYHPAFERLVELVREGVIGEVRHLRSSRLSLGKLRHEENVLWSFAPHDLSLLQRILGAARPERIRAFGTTVLQPGIPDTVHLDLAYAGGVTAHVHVSWLEPVKLHQLVVMGTEGMLVFEDSRPTDKLRLFDRGFRQEAGGWTLKRGEERVIPFEEGEPMAREIAHFLACVRTGDRPRTDGWSGVRVLEVLEAAQQELDLPVPTGSPA